VRLGFSPYSSLMFMYLGNYLANVLSWLPCLTTPVVRGVVRRLPGWFLHSQKGSTMPRSKKADAPSTAMIVVNGRSFSEAEIAAILSTRVGRGEGFYTEKADEYCLAKWTRILGDGTTIVYAVKWNDAKNRPWIHSDVNLRFNRGRPIPGFGGDEDFWLGESGLRKYHKSAAYDSDLKTVCEAARKIAASRKGK
jgi:hypothetical protein